MEEFNYRNFIHNDSDRRRLLLLLYALSCFLPDSSKIMVNIVIRFLEIMDLLQQRNELSYLGRNDRPTLEEGIENLKQEPHLQNSPEMMQMISMIEMMMKFMQMKDLMEAIGEMSPHTNSTASDPSSPFSCFKDMDPVLLEALLPPEYSEMIHIFAEMIKQNDSGTNHPDDSLRQGDCKKEVCNCDITSHDNTFINLNNTNG